jgi:hypothetical protein
MFAFVLYAELPEAAYQDIFAILKRPFDDLKGGLLPTLPHRSTPGHVRVR